MKVGIFGAGYSGQRIGRMLSDLSVPVWGTSRTEKGCRAVQDAGMVPLLFDGNVFSQELEDQLANTTHLIVSIAPPRQESADTSTDATDPVIAAMGDRSLANLAPDLEWAGYLSTVGVYGNHNGGWVDEETPVAPASERSRQRVRAEAQWQAFGNAVRDKVTPVKAGGLPVCILRLSGIYGPGRNVLEKAKNGTTRRMIKPNQVFNRIHVDDIACAVVRAAQIKAEGVFNITDDEPAPPQDVVTFAHALLGTPPPVEIDFESADISPMARSFYGENKRVSNRKSKQILGLTLQFPDYRTALTDILANSEEKKQMTKPSRIIYKSRDVFTFEKTPATGKRSL